MLDDLSEEQNDPKDIIEKYSTNPSESEFKKISQFCDKIFKGNTVEEIVENLENENSDLSKKILSTIKQKSPTSLKVALKSLRLGKEISFEECMMMEFRMVNKVMNDHDFYEGVRALIIDKDNNPNWKPNKISEVEDSFVDEFFHKLDDDLKFN